jgi:hypothetical protein
MTTGFTLTNSALLFPEGGFDLEDDHFAVMLGNVPVGTLYRIEDEWIWSLNLGMMGITSGRSDTRQDARLAFRAAWDERATRLGDAHVARALAVASGKTT